MSGLASLLRPLVLGGLALVWPIAATGSTVDRCGAIAGQIERAQDIPPGLLQAVALAESGRKHPAHGRHQAWPWAVRAGAEGFYLPSKAAALAKVRALRQEGRSNIDVGCMQINLGYHGSAFRSLEDAFEPAHNVAYGARFLKELQHETGSWARATGRYHSAEPDRSQAYRARVYQIWQDLRRRQGQGAPVLSAAGFLGGPARLAGSPATGSGDGALRVITPAIGRRSGSARPVAVLRGR
jgi:hypothetical protein